MGILHPAVEEVTPTIGQLPDKGQQRLPRAIAHTIGLHAIIHNEALPQLHRAGIGNGILILCHQVVVASYALDGNLYSSHRRLNLHQSYKFSHSFAYSAVNLLTLSDALRQMPRFMHSVGLSITTEKFKHKTTIL